jgi:RNA polymerase sigma-70 factor, ECF subfamily
MQWSFRLEHMNGSTKRKREQTEALPDSTEALECAATEPESQDQTPGSDQMSSAAVLREELPLVVDDDEHYRDEEEQTGVQPPVDLSQFETIFSRFQTPICNYLYRLVGNREQAYDLAQDVFVKAYRALSSGTTIQAGALSSWLYRIASNTATDALRRRRLIAWLPLSLFNEDRGVGAGIPTGESDDTASNGSSMFGAMPGYDGARFEQHVADREVVQHVLEKLPEKYAICLLLYEYEGFSCAEIATMLDVTPSAVKMRLMRAREKFISLYQQEVAGS